MEPVTHVWLQHEQQTEMVESDSTFTQANLRAAAAKFLGPNTQSFDVLMKCPDGDRELQAVDDNSLLSQINLKEGQHIIVERRPDDPIVQLLKKRKVEMEILQHKANNATSKHDALQAECDSAKTELAALQAERAGLQEKLEGAQAECARQLEVFNEYKKKQELQQALTARMRNPVELVGDQHVETGPITDGALYDEFSRIFDNMSRHPDRYKHAVGGQEVQGPAQIVPVGFYLTKNKYLYDAYVREVSQLAKQYPNGVDPVPHTQGVPKFQTVPGVQLNEMMVWHGTQFKNLRAILKKGMDYRYDKTGSGGAMLNRGGYFTLCAEEDHLGQPESIGKSDQYTSKYGLPPHQRRAVIVCAVCFGNCHVLQDFFAEDPRHNLQFDATTGLPMDSLCADGGPIDANRRASKNPRTQLKFREIVARREPQVYPLGYWLYYHRAKCPCAKCALLFYCHIDQPIFNEDDWNWPHHQQNPLRIVMHQFKPISTILTKVADSLRENHERWAELWLKRNKDSHDHRVRLNPASDDPLQTVIPHDWWDDAKTDEEWGFYFEVKLSPCQIRLPSDVQESLQLQVDCIFVPCVELQNQTFSALLAAAKEHCITQSLCHEDRVTKLTLSMNGRPIQSSDMHETLRQCGVDYDNVFELVLPPQLASSSIPLPSSSIPLPPLIDASALQFAVERTSLIDQCSSANFFDPKAASTQVVSILFLHHPMDSSQLGYVVVCATKRKWNSLQEQRTLRKPGETLGAYAFTLSVFAGKDPNRCAVLRNFVHHEQKHGRVTCPAEAMLLHQPAPKNMAGKAATDTANGLHHVFFGDDPGATLGRGPKFNDAKNAIEAIGVRERCLLDLTQADAIFRDIAMGRDMFDTQLDGFVVARVSAVMTNGCGKCAKVDALNHVGINADCPSCRDGSCLGNCGNPVQTNYVGDANVQCH